MTDWDLAACSGADTEIFYDADDFTHPELTAIERSSLNGENRLRALTMCAGCPIRLGCLSDAKRTKDHFAIRGGMTADRRREVSKRYVSDCPVRNPTTYNPPYFSKRAFEQFRGGKTLAQLAEQYGVTVEVVAREVRRSIATSWAA